MNDIRDYQSEYYIKRIVIPEKMLEKIQEDQAISIAREVSGPLIPKYFKQIF